MTWLERAAALAALWWLVAGCGSRPPADTRLTVRCEGQVRHLTVDQWRARPDCVLL